MNDITMLTVHSNISALKYLRVSKIQTKRGGGEQGEEGKERRTGGGEDGRRGERWILGITPRLANSMQNFVSYPITLGALLRLGRFPTLKVPVVCAVL